MYVGTYNSSHELNYYTLGWVTSSTYFHFSLVLNVKDDGVFEPTYQQ